jgi:hypothetical protein
MGLLSRLFGLAGAPRKEAASRPEMDTSSLDVGTYFALLDSIQAAQSKREYARMLEYCAQSLPLLPSLVRDSKRRYGAFDISSIPAVEIGCRYWAAMQNGDKLRQVAEMVNQVPILKREWGEDVKDAFADMEVVARIEAFIKQNPDWLQTKLSKAVGAPGKDVARVLATLENLGRVVRTRAGKTYKLRLAGSDGLV